jgi:hypothetical protein
VWPLLEIYTAVGATATTVTCTYTNTGGVDHTSVATAYGGNTNALNLATRAIPLPLAQGDTGCTAVKNVTVLASTLTAGAFGVTLIKPLAFFPAVEGIFNTVGWEATLAGCANLVEIANHACLQWFLISQGGTFGQIGASVSVVADVIES